MLEQDSLMETAGHPLYGYGSTYKDMPIHTDSHFVDLEKPSLD